jgi:hypothetical protein
VVLVFRDVSLIENGMLVVMMSSSPSPSKSIGSEPMQYGTDMRAISV